MASRPSRVARHLASALLDEERRDRIEIASFEPRQALVPHQHQELDLGLMLRVLRIEPGRAVLDGEQPVARKVIALREGNGGQPLGGQALDRIALQGGDADAHGLSDKGRERAGQGRTPDTSQCHSRPERERRGRESIVR